MNNNTYRIFHLVIDGSSQGEIACPVFDATEFGIGVRSYIREEARKLFPESKSVSVQRRQGKATQVQATSAELKAQGIKVLARPSKAKAKAAATVKQERTHAFFERVSEQKAQAKKVTKKQGKKARKATQPTRTTQVKAKQDETGLEDLPKEALIDLVLALSNA